LLPRIALPRLGAPQAAERAGPLEVPAQAIVWIRRQRLRMVSHVSIAAEAPVPFDRFLADEERSEQRHEWVAGHVYAMAGGTERHDLVTGIAYELLAARARQAGCRAFAGNRKVKTRAAAYYPDLLIVCGRAANRLFENDAVLLIEVLSEHTARTDRTEKALAYAGLPSLRQYVLIDPESRRVEVGVPKDGEIEWIDRLCPGAVLHSPFRDVSVEELYDLVDASATT
jgi:Uma2 family endonuclease